MTVLTPVTATDTAAATDALTRSGMRRAAAAADTAAATDVASRTNVHQTAKVTDAAQAKDTNTRVGNKWFAAGSDTAPAIDSNGTGILRYLIQWSLDVSQSAARSRDFSATIRVRPAIVPTPPLTTVLQ